MDEKQVKEIINEREQEIGDKIFRKGSYIFIIFGAVICFIDSLKHMYSINGMYIRVFGILSIVIGAITLFIKEIRIVDDMDDE